MILVKNELDQLGKPFVAVWYEGDIVCVLDDWNDVKDLIAELTDSAMSAFGKELDK